MDKKKLKRIIAREGLVILIIIVIGVSCLGIAEFIKNYHLLPHYEIELSNGRKYEISLKDPNDLPASDEDVKSVVLETIKKENYPPDVTIKSIKLIRGKNEGFIKTQLKIERIRNFGFYFLLFAYPVYLLIRFIIWAVRTLRER